MARHDDDVGILADSRAHSAHGLWLTNVAGNLAIGASASVGDALQGLPHGALKWCAPNGLQREIEALTLA